MALLFVGRSTFDIGYVCARFPREDEKLPSTLSYSLAGGPALNAAVAARRLAARCGSRRYSEGGRSPPR